MDGINTTNAENMRTDRISINFSEREPLSNEAMQIAKDGGQSNNKIMEASGAAFVLKEIGNATASGLQGNLYPNDEEKNDVRAQITAITASFLPSDIANRITEQDSKFLEEDGEDPAHKDSERLERLLEARKAMAELIARGIEGQREQLRTERENAEETGRKNALSDIRVAQIAKRLEAADLPVTDSNVSRIAEAMKLAEEAQFMTDASFSYLIENRLQPTIQNCYRAVHSGRGGRRIVSEEAFKELLPSIEKVAADAGIPASEGIKETARKLLEDGIAITPETLTIRTELEEIPAAVENGELSEDTVMEGAVEMLKYRHDPKDTNLYLLLKREQARLELTEQSAERMKKLGVEPDIESIKRRIEELTVAEHKASQAQARLGTVYEPDEAARIFDETISAKDTIEAAGDRAVAATYTQRYSVSFRALAISAGEIIRTSGNATAAAKEMASSAYEASATEVRRDLGDSINKAFGHIDEILGNLNLPATEGNRRAVRILGYNSIEITKENISEMKHFDAEVRDLIHDLKPQVTAELIKRGVNPLEKTVRELSQAAREVNKELGTTPEERFSEYLVRMERSGKITEEQRDSFIGIYRMLYRIEKTDGAAVGALVKSGRELTLRNLLTEARTRRYGRFDKSVTPAEGERELVTSDEEHENSTAGLTIEEQVASAYETSMLDKAAGYATPERLKALFDGSGQKEAELPGFRPEQLYEALRTIPEGNEDLAGRTENLEELRKTLQGFETEKQFLEAFAEDDSAVNVRAAQLVLAGANPIGTAVKIASEKADESEKTSDEAKSVETTVSTLPDTERELSEKLEDLRLTAAEMMDWLYMEADLTGTEAKQLSEMSNLIRLSGRLSKHRFYSIPLEDESGITNINLTLVHETGTIGSFKVSFADGIYAEAGVSNGRLNMFVTAESTELASKLKDGRKELSERLMKLGFEKADVFSGIGRRKAEFAEIPENNGNVETASLYKAARETVLYLRSLIK